eukprot:scaffold89790_cov21-Tisochrysis_lutea.AAC.2
MCAYTAHEQEEPGGLHNAPATRSGGCARLMFASTCVYVCIQPAGVASQEARAGPQPHVSKVRARNIQNVCGCLPLLMEVAQRAVMEHPPSSQHPCPVGSALQPPSSLPAMSLVPGAAQPAQPLEAGTAAGVAAGTAAGGDQLLKGGPGGDVQPIQQQGSDQNNAPVFPSPCWATDGGAGYLTELHSAITHLLYNIVQDVDVVWKPDWTHPIVAGQLLILNQGAWGGVPFKDFAAVPLECPKDVIDHHQQQQQQQEQHQTLESSMAAGWSCAQAGARVWTYAFYSPMDQMPMGNFQQKHFRVSRMDTCPWEQAADKGYGTLGPLDGAPPIILNWIAHMSGQAKRPLQQCGAKSWLTRAVQAFAKTVHGSTEHGLQGTGNPGALQVLHTKHGHQTHAANAGDMQFACKENLRMCMRAQVVTTSGVCEGEGRPGPESMDEILTHHLGTPTGMLRSLSVATPTPGNRCAVGTGQESPWVHLEMGFLAYLYDANAWGGLLERYGHLSGGEVLLEAHVCCHHRSLPACLPVPASRLGLYCGPQGGDAGFCKR